MHYTLYQINTRTWLSRHEWGTIGSVPMSFWQNLRSKGVDIVWLMGVWETSQSSIEQYCFHPDLVQSYYQTNAHWKNTDVGGSPYAIEDYIPSRLIGTIDELSATKLAINQVGMKLVLDFIPNHLNALSELTLTQSQLFLSVSEEQFKQDSHTFYKRGKSYLAHGRDPYFPAWTDTAQLDYSKVDTHEFMTDRLKKVAELCDGVRCDMAMLLLPRVFRKTWKIPDPKHIPNFWQKVIPEIKSTSPGFLFIAEAYWGTEAEMIAMGFDYVYDKELLDRLAGGPAERVRIHLQAESSFQQHLVRFIENHDEQRSLKHLGEMRSRAASVAMATLPGLRLYFDGQWEGSRTRQPVQLVLPANEYQCPCSFRIQDNRQSLCRCQETHYERLLSAVNNPVFKRGIWSRVSVLGDSGLLAWSWQYGKEYRLVVINYSDHFVTDAIRPNVSMPMRQKVYDVLNDSSIDHCLHFMEDQWHVSLPAYKSVIVSIQN